MISSTCRKKMLPATSCQAAMVAIGRALISNPKVLLCDETGLKSTGDSAFLRSFPAISEQQLVIVVDMDIRRRCCDDRVYCMMEGVTLKRQTKRSTQRRYKRRYFEGIMRDQDHCVLFRAFCWVGYTRLSRRAKWWGIACLHHSWRFDRSSPIPCWFVTGITTLKVVIVAAPVTFTDGPLQRLVLNRVLGPDILPPLLVTLDY